MQEPVSASDSSAEPTSPGPPAYRLVIRAQVITDQPADTSARPNSNSFVLGLAAGVVVLLGLGWVAVTALTTESVPSTATIESPGPVTRESSAPASPSPIANAQPNRPPLTADSTSSQVAPGAAGDWVPNESLESEAPPRPINSAIPEVSQNALQTIRGTIRVTVQVTIDRQGEVINAAPVVSGPSRYFQRRSLEASKKWTFAPADTESRQALLRFNFTRNGATAHAEEMR